jgi:hypothetical protein
MNQDAKGAPERRIASAVFRFGPQEPSQNALWRGFPKGYKNAPETARPAHELARYGGNSVR